MFVVARTLPLDLEVRLQSSKRLLARGKITSENLDQTMKDLMDEWQIRYDIVDKGEWTKLMIPSVSLRRSLPLILDHYTTQFLTGHVMMS